MKPKTEKSGLSHKHGKSSHTPPVVQEDIEKRLNRIEGQVRGLKGMVEREEYCDNLLNQIAAIQSALSSVATIILENHMNTCVTDKIKSSDEHIIPELMNTIKRLIK